MWLAIGGGCEIADTGNGGPARAAMGKGGIAPISNTKCKQLQNHVNVKRNFQVHCQSLSCLRDFGNFKKWQKKENLENE